MVGNFRRFVMRHIAVIGAGVPVALAAYPSAPLVAQTPVVASVPDRAAAAVRVSIDVDNASLVSVVQDIAQQAGLIPAINWTLVPQNARVTLHIKNVPVGDAYELALRGTGLVAQIRATGNVTILRGGDTGQAGGSVAGRIADSVTKQPLARVTVSLDNGVSSTITRETGAFQFSGLSAGKHTVTARALGYSKQIKKIVVQDGESVQLNFMLVKSVNALDQVVVTGTIAATELRAIPNAITVITAKQLEERGITHIDQLFRGDVPGLFAQNLGTAPKGGEAGSQKRGAVKMFSRGATVLDSASPPIKTFVDGVELADADYLNQIDPAGIERIEIIPGPQASAIYGSGALGGVMQIFMKKGMLGQRRPQVTLSLSYGMLENDFSSSLAPRHNDALSITDASGPYSYSLNGGYDYEGQWTPGSYTRTYHASGGLFRSAGPFNITLSTAISKQRLGAGGGGRQQIVSLVEEGKIVNDPQITVPEYGSVYDIFHDMIGSSLSYRPFSWWSHSLTMGFDESRNGQETNGARYTIPSDSLAVSYNYSNPQQKTFSYNTTIVRKTGWISEQLTLGGNAQSFSSLTTSARGKDIDNLGQSGDFITETRSHGASRGYFASGLFSVANTVYLTAGFRAEPSKTLGAKRRTDITPTWGLVLAHDIGDVTAKGRFTFGRATRLPAAGASADETYCVQSPGNCSYYTLYFTPNTLYQLANPELRPESQSGPDGGLDLYFGSRGSLSITHYNQKVKDLLSFVEVGSVPSVSNPNSTLPQYQWQNLGDMANSGWTGAASLNVGPLGFNGTYSWTKSRVTRLAPGYTGRLMVGGSTLGMAEHTGALSVAYSVVGTSLVLSVNGRGQVLQERRFGYGGVGVVRDGAFYFSPNVSGAVPVRAIPPSHTFALNASRVITRKVNVFLNIQNAGNMYENEGDNTQNFYPVLGRQTLLGARIEM